MKSGLVPSLVHLFMSFAEVLIGDRTMKSLCRSQKSNVFVETVVDWHNSVRFAVSDGMKRSHEMWCAME